MDDKIGGKGYLLKEIERKLTLSLIGSSRLVKEQIRSTMEDVEKLRKLLDSEERALRRGNE